MLKRLKAIDADMIKRHSSPIEGHNYKVLVLDEIALMMEVTDCDDEYSVSPYINPIALEIFQELRDIWHVAYYAAPREIYKYGGWQDACKAADNSRTEFIILEDMS